MAITPTSAWKFLAEDDASWWTRNREMSVLLSICVNLCKCTEHFNDCRWSRPQVWCFCNSDVRTHYLGAFRTFCYANQVNFLKHLVHTLFSGRKSDAGLWTYAVLSAHPSNSWASCWLYPVLLCMADGTAAVTAHLKIWSPVTCT